MSLNIIVMGGSFKDLMGFAPTLPKPGETITGSKFFTSFGGKAANQCVMSARLGSRTGMITKVGDDLFGREYLSHFTEESIDTSKVTVSQDESTGVALIAVNDAGENSIIIIPGASGQLTASDMSDAADLISKADLLVCQLEVPMETTMEALKIARQHNVRTLLNAAPGRSDLPADAYSLSDIFCVNETEAELCTGIKAGGLDDSKSAVNHLISKGCKCVILTLGVQGVLFASQDDPQCKHVAAFKVKAVDTTGAGDAFVGALTYFLVYHKELSMNEMISRSCFIASISVQHTGTQTSFPRKDKLPQHLFS